MANEIVWEGLTELNYALRNSPETVARILPLALSEEASIIFARSQYLVPVDTGVLRASGHIDAPKFDGKRTYVEMGYGGPSAKYATWVHEGYARHAPPTQRKYLEDPVRSRAPYLKRNIGIRINNVLKSMFGS